MKKRNLLMGIIGCGLLFIQTVKAETVNFPEVTETGKNVVVGEVETPVYSVDITWGNMEFDYVYNEVTGKYEWKSELTCEKLESWDKDTYNLGWNDIYSDESCTNSATYSSFEEALDSNAYKGYDDISSSIVITDNSVRGHVAPKLYWTSESDYDYVIGEFYGDGFECGLIEEDKFPYYKDFAIYSDAACEVSVIDQNPVFGNMPYYGPMTSYKNIQYGEILKSTLGDQDHSTYVTYLRLKNDTTKEITTPKSGDTIGRVTIIFEAR